MNRRFFITLIASAPIAALAPLPKILERLNDPQLGIRYVKKWNIGPDRWAIVRPDFAVRVFSSENPYESQPRTDAERLALKMVTEARERFHAQN